MYEGEGKLANIIGVIGLPIVFLNFGGEIIGGIWLAILREWKLLLAGVGFGIFCYFFLMLLLLIAAGFGFAAIGFYRKGNPIGLGYLFGFLSQAYTNSLIVGTCLIASGICFSFCEGKSRLQCIPYYLWAWGMGLGHWQFLASKERDNPFTAISLFVASIFYLLYLVTLLVSGPIILVSLSLFVLAVVIVIPIVNIVVTRRGIAEFMPTAKDVN